MYLISRSALPAIVTAAGLLGGAAVSVQSETLISPGSDWKFFKGVRSPASPTVQWHESKETTNQWPSAPAPFRYGDGRGGTLLEDMSRRYTSIYFYKTFDVQNLSHLSAVDLGVNFDDGVIVWINGKPLIHENSPTSPRFDSRAIDTHESGEFQVFEFRDPSVILRPGTNTIAAHGFNISPESSDFYFDLFLVGIEIDHTPPKLVSITPSPGKVPWIDEITLQFSESVLGMEGAQFSLGAKPPIALVSEGSKWILKFEPPGFGETSLRWSSNHRVTDYARPPNLWMPSQPSLSYHYHVIDEQAPLIASIHPLPNTTLRSLDKLEIFFNEAVTQFDASDLRINGSPPTNVTGMLNGPWRIRFDSVESGPAQISWSPSQDIHDLAARPNRFLPQNWAYQIDNDLAHERVVINEFACAPECSLFDDNQDSSDWIELKNIGTTRVNLAGWSISDQANQPQKWIFPSVSIEPGEILLIYASGKDRRDPLAPLHTNFRLNANGEHLGLYNAELPRRRMDMLKKTYPLHPEGYSYGLVGTDQYAFMVSPSPGSANDTDKILVALDRPEISKDSGMFRDPFALTIGPPTNDSLVRYTLDA